MFNYFVNLIFSPEEIIAISILIRVHPTRQAGIYIRLSVTSDIINPNTAPIIPPNVK